MENEKKTSYKLITLVLEDKLFNLIEEKSKDIGLNKSTIVHLALYQYYKNVVRG